MAHYLLGVDIGGTKVAAGLVNDQGALVFKTRNPMNPTGTAEEGFAAVRTAIDSTFAQNPGLKVEGIGIISPGPLDPKRGVVINPPNIPGWRNFELAKEVERAYHLHVLLDNDANAAGLAEAVWGVGKGYENVLYGTLGTGFGTGIILHGRIYHGRTGAAAEGGHVSIDYRGAVYCNCGKPGCIEGLVSGTGIARRARERVAKGGQAGATILELAGGRIENVHGETVGSAWHRGDPLAKEILQETADFLTVWVGNMIDVLEPDVIVFGGGVSELMHPWFSYIQQQAPKWSVNQRAAEIPLLEAKFGADAGIAGAAALCLGIKASASSGVTD
ncbi:MAG TPA: ROK family protein [Terriglobales bacterium]|nr:ROK family protein [Terriglobales bacterium]